VRTSWILTAVLAVSCDSPKQSTTTAPSTSSTPAPIAAPSPTPSPTPSASAPPHETVDESEGAVPPLAGPDGKPLPQTEEKPSLRSKSYEKRIKLLWKAIVTDDPKIAMPAFFPLIAYKQVKAIPNPEADWNGRLVKAFERDIHAAHKELGNGAGSAILAGLDLPEDKAKWMPPGSEGNKVGYFRALGSKLRYQDASGGARAIEITSLISWRGEWYVVHVHGFK
jgi:hypothetical protein